MAIPTWVGSNLVICASPFIVLLAHMDDYTIKLHIIIILFDLVVLCHITAEHIIK
jgi:hypothetical protein